MKRYGEAVSAKTSDGERRLFSGSEADILADLHMDAQTIVAAILHDVIEDTATAKEEIAERFGPEVAELVDLAPWRGRAASMTNRAPSRRKAFTAAWTG